MADVKKRKKPFAANAASLKYLRDSLYFAETVEKWIPFIKRRKDLFSFIDIVAIREDGTIGIQTTTAPNVAARRDKILVLPAAKVWLKAGNAIFLHSWAKRRVEKGKVKKWSLVVHEITLADFEGRRD